MTYVTNHENQIKFKFGEGTVASTLTIYVIIKLHNINYYCCYYT